MSAEALGEGGRIYGLQESWRRRVGERRAGGSGQRRAGVQRAGRDLDRDRRGLRDDPDGAEQELRSMRRVAQHPAAAFASGFGGESRSSIFGFRSSVEGTLARLVRARRTAVGFFACGGGHGLMPRAEGHAARHGGRELHRELQHGHRKRARGEAAAEGTHEKGCAHCAGSLRRAQALTGSVRRHAVRFPELPDYSGVSGVMPMAHARRR